LSEFGERGRTHLVCAKILDLDSIALSDFAQTDITAA
jgi:hypothetical protein